MSGASIQATIDAAHAQHVKPAFDRYVQALKYGRENPADVDRALVSMILALEDAADATKQIGATLRTILVDSMAADGVKSFETDHHTIVRAQAAQRVQMIDSKAFLAAHPDLATPQDPKPDTAEIGRRLRAGQAIVGATLSNGGPETLRISARKA